MKFRDSLSYQALLALVKLAGVLRKAGDRFFRGYGLTQSQFNILMVLRHTASEGCTQTELCRHLLVRGANMTGLVRRLEARGLIARDVDPADERVWIVRLTARGKRLLDRVEPEYYRRIDGVMGVHSEAELRRFSVQLERTREALTRNGM
jgi:DNA-binding MarR family transcriptional regulator